MSIYTPASSEASGATALADALIDNVEAIAYRAPDKFAIARTADEVQKFQGRKNLDAARHGKRRSDGDLANLKHFHQRGVRYITLAHSKSTTSATRPTTRSGSGKA